MSRKIGITPVQFEQLQRQAITEDTEAGALFQWQDARMLRRSIADLLGIDVVVLQPDESCPPDIEDWRGSLLAKH